MKRYIVPLLALTLLTSASAAAAGGEGPPRVQATAFTPASDYREITWEDLIPQDWDAMSTVKNMDFSNLKDNDPRAIEALKKLKAEWNHAPVEPSIDGARVRLSGFAVPIERKRDAVTELLLVPYFGACIHVPPPPANQVVHVVLKNPAKKLMTMDALWVNGTIRIQRGDGNGLGTYGYRLVADQTEAIVFPEDGK